MTPFSILLIVVFLAWMVSDIKTAKTDAAKRDDSEDFYND
jgi:hypothetical protein